MHPMLVVGSVALDTIHNALGSHKRVLGGSATYGSIAGSVFAPVRLVGVVGKDYPDSAIALFKERGVNVEGLEVTEGLTFHWEGRYSDDLTSRTSLCTDLNVFADFHPKIPEAFRDTPFVMLGNIAPELQLEVLEQIREPKLVLADTMNFWIEGKRKELERVLGRVDLLVINEEEARQLSGLHDISKVAAALLAMGPRMLVIKRGEYGAMLWAEGEVFSAPAYPVAEVKDPTGAGDSFAGGMLGYIARAGELSTRTLRRSVVYGSAAASHCVERVGVEGIAKLDEGALERRFNDFRDLAAFDPAE